MGFPATTAERSPAALQQLHCLEVSRYRRLQNRRSSRLSETLGHPEKSLVYELRQDVTCFALLLPRQHPEKGSGRETLLPVS